ncbi:putative vacuolar protein sorting protein [Phaeomoniella chlamydospora]|uniref:E3 ubiquitin-protein ligase PEP5 n=1 Tax=Phaeomoniella chlamydospora TaxID=158046 RepID=A0A0G2EZJ7_PHACM|nr:putative vacuolar protein sorting protein [Phaeomoniella chlamydospora]
MALPAWKTFPFFNVEEVSLPATGNEDGEDGSSILNNDVTALTTGSDTLFLGTAEGTIRILSSSFKEIRSFNAYDSASIRLLRQIESTSLLVSVAEDLSSEPVLKVWALDQSEKRGATDGGPKCLSTTKISNGRKLFPVSAFVVLQDLSQVAVGFANGGVTVIRGDLIHDRGTRQRTVFESEEPITGLQVREAGITTLYIATTSKIVTLAIAGRGQGSPPKTLDNSGCGVGCMAMDPETKDIIVARDDAIYSYGPGGRGQPYAFEGPKTLVKVYRDYVALVCPPRVAQMSKSKAFRRLGADQMDDLFSTSSFSLLDPDLRYIGHTESLSTAVKEVFSVWGDLFLVTIDGKLYRYREKSLKEKLEILYQRNLYIYAINLAQKSGVDKLQQNIIFRKYGDHLYQKGDYDTAMQQYLRAIDNTEPSQVIRKFLDTQRIHNLIEYLEELHDHEKATADHTTLLLNCYAKLKDTEKLDAFIKAPGELKFDLETAIIMCRQGGYFEQAAYLATKHGENDMVVDILIEDSKKYAEALEFIWRLDPEPAYTNLMRYARVLLAHCPADTTKLFIEYYTGKYRPKEDIPEETASPQRQEQSGGALQNLAALLPLPYMSRSALATPSEQQATTTSEAKLAPPESVDTVTSLEYSAPLPRSAFSSFVSHPQEFISFLEALLQQPDLSSTSLMDLRTTLFEIYLQEASTASTKADRERYQSLAKSLIESSAKADPKDSSISNSEVLLLSTLSNFEPGKTLIRELASLHGDIFRSHTNAKDTAGALSALQRYGPETPSLYLDALTYVSSSPQILEEAGGEKALTSILREIQTRNLLSPLQVIQLLSSTSVIKMGMIKDYLSSNIEKERKVINSNRQLINSYRTETAAKRTEIEELSSKPTIFNARRCASCTQPLELPVVHFMCKHSFHRRCLDASTTSGMPSRFSSRVDDADDADTASLECPNCKPANDTIKAIRRSQMESAAQQDLFKTAVERETGGESRWGVISEFFGRGVMNSGISSEG